MREAYDEVYQGNKNNIEEATEHYLKEYEQYIYEGPEASITPLAGKHLKYIAMSAKESAAGMDQWCP